MINYRTYARDGTFIQQYISYMDGLETPLSYDFWTACWLLGSAVGRGVFVDRPRIPVYMNWFVILAADSGVTRKTTAVVRATKTFRNLLETRSEEVLIESKTTPEKLSYRLGLLSEEFGHASIAIAIPELVTFLGRERYTMQMPALLTDLYDCPDSRALGGTVGRVSYNLRNVFVTFLSASTPSWLMRAINPDVIEGGFTSRCIFVVDETRKKRIAWPSAVDDSTDRASLQRLLLLVSQEARDVGAIPLTDAAVQRLTRWYNRRVESRDPYRVSFEAREDEHVLRMAGTLAINEQLYKVEARHITHAIKIIGEAKTHGAGLFGAGISPDRILLGIDLVRTILVESGHEGIQQNKLFHKVRHRLRNEEMQTLLALMHEHDMVQMFELALSSKAKKRARVWRATRHITEKGRIDSVLTNLRPG